MFDYRLLEAFACVIQEGGFERAARALHITQSAVSQRIRQLEEAVGQVLLTRTKPPAPTEAGRRMLKHCLQVRLLEEDLRDNLGPGGGEDHVSLAIGVNADSLALWFLDAVRPFLLAEPVVLDLRTLDQEETLLLLRDGEVAGCISAEARTVQGCRAERLGSMDYRLTASPGFAARWFPEGLSLENVSRAPILVFNRSDTLHVKLCRQALGATPETFAAFYLPSTERFPWAIAEGLACGMLPEQQSTPLLADGSIVDLAPGHVLRVDLYWHAWNINSELLGKLGRCLAARARELLGP
ncbi:LysR family transcriptional regulator ArgP [Desulfocurvibacter africanus]|uniref:LysR family transcriptional regulator ArgP n=1 Tax=Desulfocurvibacter africanus TaxID=873 RepID=UPI0003FF35AF|nr:LysR family transcriptional regulator ArgP [Desulfocurvibacter africanus]